MTWKLVRVDENCWIPQGGRITYLQEYVLLSSLWQHRSLEQCQTNQGNSNEGKAFLFQVMVLVGQQWTPPQGFLTVSGQTNWWSWSCLIQQSYRKPERQAHISNSRAGSSKSRFGFWLKGNMTEISAAPLVAEWSLHYSSLALEHPAANPPIAAPLFSEENVGCHKIKDRMYPAPTQLWHITLYAYFLLLAYSKCSKALGHLNPPNLDRTLYDAKEHWRVCVSLSDGRWLRWPLTKACSLTGTLAIRLSHRLLT